MSFSQFKKTTTIAVAASTLALLVACNDDTSGDADDSADEPDQAENGQAGQAPEFYDSTTVSTRGELQAALDSLAAEDREDLSDPDEAYLIEIDSDINTGFDSNGRLSYEGDINLYLRSATDQITLDAGTHSGIIEFDPNLGPNDADIWIDNLRFENGFLDDASPSDSEGAAIFSTHSLFILGSDFHNNRSDGDNGGAVSTRADTRVENSTFTNNQADGRGGAISVTAENNDLTIDESTFENNTSTDNGGGALFADIVTVENSTFTGNKSQGDATRAGRGGAIWARFGGDITDSTFTGNESEWGGGAIWYGHYHGGGTSERVSVEIENSEFRNNITDENGSAIWSEGDTGNGDSLSIRVVNSVFENNGYSGTSIHNQDATAIYSWAENEKIISADTEYIDNEGPVLYSEEGELVDEGGNSFTPSDHEPTWD